ncbi:MAG: AI-2E family transporter [bacterium]|nr:AI-2E family transporter [bacterium]
MGERDPWSWVTEARVTYALKLLLLLALALYLGSLVLAFLARIAPVVYIAIGAVFFTYLIYPLVSRLARRMPMVAAIAVVYATLAVALAIAGWLVIPRIAGDVSDLVRNWPQLAASINAYLSDPNNPILSRLPDSARDEVLQIPVAAAQWLREHGFETVGRVMSVALGAFAAVATFVVVPLLSAYLLLDLARLRAAMLRLIPDERRDDVLAFLGDVDRIFGGFIRGQLLVALCVGVMLTIALLAMHVRYAFLLGLLAAFGDLIPYVGAILTFIPAVGIALANNGWVNAAIVAGLFVGIYEIEGHLIAPTIVGSQVKLSPLMVLLAILIGAELGGVLGMLLAVPIAGILRVIVLRASKQSSP